MDQEGVGDKNNRRVWERLAYQKALRLVFDDGLEVTGSSSDVSLMGTFLHLERIPASIIVGKQGMLHVESLGGRQELFPCEVRRVAADGVALFISERAAMFALLLSQDIFEGWSRKP